jgi:uncharacterized protein YegP (UPF0339 family)
MRITLQYPKYTGPRGEAFAALRTPIDEGDCVRDGDRYYFEIQAGGNYETITVSEIYNEKIDAMSAIQMFRDAGMQFEFVDKTATDVKHVHIEAPTVTASGSSEAPV